MVLNVEVMDTTRFIEKHYNHIKDGNLKNVSERAFFENCSTQLSDERKYQALSFHKGYRFQGRGLCFFQIGHCYSKTGWFGLVGLVGPGF